MSKYFQWRGALLDDFGIGKTAFWLVSIPSVLGVLTVLPTNVSIARGFALWLVTSIVCTGFLGIVFLAGAELRSRVVIAGPMKQVIVLVTMLLAGAARGLGVVLVFQLAGVADRATVVGRVVGSSVIFTVWLVLIGGFLSALAAYRAARQELLDEIVMRELQMRLIDEGRVANQRESAAVRMSETTAMVREILESADVGSPDDYSRISLLLHRAIDERIRPLVHEMWFEPAPEFDAPPSTRAFLRKAFLTPVPLAWAFGLYAFIATSGAIITVGWKSGIVAAAIEWSAFVMVILGERVIRPKPSIVSRVITTIMLLVLPLLSAWLVLGERLQGQIPFFGLLALAITAPILALTCCAARASLDDRGPSLRELQLRLERDDWVDQLASLEKRSAENSMASVIHNTVQARLLAAAIQLETAAMTNDQGRAESALEDARTALDSAEVPGPVSPSAPAERLRSIAEAWRGIITVEIVLDPGIESSASARLALDAIEECVANAARHASATVVEVSFRKVSDGLEVIVMDNGSAFEVGTSGGVGSDWMQRISAGRMSRIRSQSGWNEVRLLLA